VLFCNNKKNKLFKNVNKNSKILGKHHMFCLNSTYPFMKGQGLAWVVEGPNCWGQRNRSFWQVIARDALAEAPTCPFPLRETTQSHQVGGQRAAKTKNTEVYNKVALRTRTPGTFTNPPIEHLLWASTRL
jgi:hypothetical protein